MTQESLEDVPLACGRGPWVGTGKQTELEISLSSRILSLPAQASRSVLPRKEVLEGAVIVLVERCVDERVEEGVGVAEPKEDALPDGGDVVGAERADELRGEEGQPAEREHPDEDAHHQGSFLLLLFPPRVPFCLEGDSGVADGEHHLGLLRRGLCLEKISRSSMKGSLGPSGLCKLNRTLMLGSCPSLGRGSP